MTATNAIACTCGLKDGHTLSCSSILVPLYKREISMIAHKQKTSGIELKAGAALSMDQFLLFDIAEADRGIFPVKIGTAGDTQYDSFCRDTQEGRDAIEDTPYLLNWAIGGQELHGIVTSALVIIKIKSEWNMFHVWSPACDVLKKLLPLIMEE